MLNLCRCCRTKCIRDPAIEVRQRARADRLLFCDRLFIAAQARAIRLLRLVDLASGGNNPKLMFIGWNERGPASMVSMWPPVMWPSSAPSAVVCGGALKRVRLCIRRRIESGNQSDAADST